MTFATLIVRNIGELATCDPARDAAPGVVPDAVVAAADATLVYAGPAAGCDVAPAPGCVEIDAAGAAVIPGFVDAHTHIVWLGDRADEYARRAAGETYESIARNGGGIRATVRATGAGSVADLTAAAHERAVAMLRGGTTTAEVKSGYGLLLDAEMRQLEAAAALRGSDDVPDIVTTYLPLHAAPDGDRDAFIDGVIDHGLPAAVAAGAEFVDAFCEDGAFSVAECERVFGAARRLGLVPRLHTEQRTRTGGAQLAARCGAASADHLDHCTDDDLRALAAADVTGVLLPGASLILDGPPPPGRRLIDMGVTAAIATDCNPGTCFSESMALMTSLAVACAGLTPAEALVAATRGGATALQRADRGVLRAGLRADFSILTTPRWLDVAYHMGGEVIARVVRRGAVVV